MNKKTKFSILFILGITLLSTILIYFPTKETYSVQTINQLVNVKPENTPGKGGSNGGGKDKPIDIQYELFIEIDYMVGHEPTPEVLDYISNYYYAKGIIVTFNVNEEITTPYGDISDTEFWAIEKEYNDIWIEDDRANGSQLTGEYESKEKWVLFGTSDESYQSMGYAWASQNAGNYIFIADQTCDEYALNAASQGVIDVEVEAVVLMHELGHSIGILKIVNNVESYDRDVTSVMSLVNPENCNAVDKKGNIDWHYSRAYWKLKNLEYYTI